MSWDIILMRPTKGDAAEPLGPRAEVLKTIERVARGIQWTVPGFGVLERGDFCLEVSVGEADPVTSVGLTPRGMPDFDPMELVEALAKELRCQAIDPDGEAIDFDVLDRREDPEFSDAFTAFFTALPDETRAGFFLEAMESWSTTRRWSPAQEAVLAPFYEARGEAPKSYMEFFRAVGWHEMMP